MTSIQYDNEGNRTYIMEPSRIVHGENGTCLVYERPFLEQAVSLITSIESGKAAMRAGRFVDSADLWHLLEEDEPWEEDD